MKKRIAALKMFVRQTRDILMQKEEFLVKLPSPLEVTTCVGIKYIVTTAMLNSGRITVYDTNGRYTAEAGFGIKFNQLTLSSQVELLELLGY